VNSIKSAEIFIIVLSLDFTPQPPKWGALKSSRLLSPPDGGFRGLKNGDLGVGKLR